MTPLMTSEDLSTFLGVPIGTLNQWASRHIGPRFIKVGRYRRYRVADVEEWLVANESDGAEPT